MIAAAQQSIDAMQEESMQWIKQDLAASEAAFMKIEAGQGDADTLEQVQLAILSLKSRAGIFGYQVASEIAQMLYSFLRGNYDPQKSGHNPIVRQCMEAMKIVLAKNIKLQDGVAKELVKELRQALLRL
jgi:chemotaxis protein histidine kinase CheA